VVFAAAYKHVPLMEHHPAEAILNNVRHPGMADISNRYGVKIFVLISTDRRSIAWHDGRLGVSPRSFQRSPRPAPRHFCWAVRQRRGSRASVVPIFNGRSVRQKHYRHTSRFVRLATIPEAVQLVIQAGSLGEIFRSAGDPVKIVDLPEMSSSRARA
jgi:FlaA1/EpsC-like NDP-sugar epimerase